MIGSQLIRRRLAALALLACVGVPYASAQFGGRENEAVIYLLAGKGKVDFKVVPPTTSNAGITGFQTLNPASLPDSVISPDYAAKVLKVLHKESGDLFALVTQTENIVTPRAKVVAPAKLFTLGGILRDANEGSVSLAPLDVTGGLYVPYIPGVAQGPDVAMDVPQFLFWTPSDSSPPFVQVPDGTHSTVGIAGATGIEFEAFAGVAAFFVPWTNMKVAYPADNWPQGVDIKVLDDDAQVGNSARIMRLRPAKATPFFTLAANTHFFVLEGTVTIAAPGAATVTVPRGYYAFVPRGYAISVTNPRVFSTTDPTNVDGH